MARYFEKRRRRQEFLTGFSAWVAAPEDVILKKMVFFLEGGSKKHLDDIRGILTNTPIDRVYLETWAVDLRVSDVWATVQQK